ncbi:uncharacterized protein LOC134435828 [Engraulis encrasicolus]|uniref:uncharacterized protein LOC134435828 n=1 Tax=Engraulis encrasicolus TaxID=184585 RepID=UPI002FD57CEE
MGISSQSALWAVLRAAGGGYAVTGTAAQAIAEAQWLVMSAAYPDALALAEHTGAFGLALLLCCATMGIALWSTALGIGMATAASGLMNRLGASGLGGMLGRVVKVLGESSLARMLRENSILRTLRESKLVTTLGVNNLLRNLGRMVGGVVKILRESCLLRTIRDSRFLRTIRDSHLLRTIRDSRLLSMLGLEAVSMSCTGPLVVLGASGAGALLGATAESASGAWALLGATAESVLQWGSQELIAGPCVVLLVVLCIVMRVHWLFITQLIVFLITHFIVMFLGMVVSFAHPGAYILVLIMLYFGTDFPAWLCTLPQKILSLLTGQLPPRSSTPNSAPPDSPHFLLYTFCAAVTFAGLLTGVTAFFLTYRQKRQQATAVLLCSCGHVAPLCATILGAVMGIYFLLGLNTWEAEHLAAGAVAATILALEGVRVLLGALGPCATAGLLVGVSSAAGLALEAAVIAAKMRHGGAGAAGALLGALGGAVLGAISLSQGRKMLLLSVTAAVSAMPNMERVASLGYGGGTGLGEARVNVVVNAVFLGLAAFGMGALGLGFITMGISGDFGFIMAVGGGSVAVTCFLVFTVVDFSS